MSGAGRRARMGDFSAQNLVAKSFEDWVKWHPHRRTQAPRGQEEDAMSNPIEDLGHDIKVGATDVGKGVVQAVNVAVVQPIQFAVKAEKVIATAVKDQPVVRDAIVTLVKQASTVIDDFKTDVGDGLFNLRADEQTIKDAEAFFNWFKSTFVPSMEQVYGDLSADEQ